MTTARPAEGHWRTPSVTSSSDTVRQVEYRLLQQATGRQAHHPPLAERFAPDPPPPDQPTPLEAMAHRLRTQGGKKLYALRKHTPEPVFGIIKSALGFRQFLLRGLDEVRGEWNLVTMAFDLKRLFALAGAG